MTDDIAPSTGPVADQTFKQGFIAVVTLAVIGTGAVATSGLVPLPHALAGGLLAFPVVVLAGSCALGVWLGYADEARYRGAKVAVENNRRE